MPTCPRAETGPYYLWVNSSHRLAACRSVKLEQLDECKFLIPSNIRPDETMIVNEEDLNEPAYSLVPGRRRVPLEDIEELIKPCFAFLKSNENPAL